MNSHFRDEFPFLREGCPDIVYLDSAATTLKPDAVVQAVVEHYRLGTANVRRSVHALGERSTIAFERSREAVASFIRADKNEIVFTASCTDSINFAAELLDLRADDVVLVSQLEHHSNLLPWRARAQVRDVRLDPSGVIDLDALESGLRLRPRLVGVSWVSNVTGNVQPVKAVVELAHHYGSLVLVDAAQAAGHFPLDVAALSCDLVAFSAHKMLGPSGVGILYGREELLARLLPKRLGGGMVSGVGPCDYTLRALPFRFEAGTPNIEGVIAYGRAIEFFYRHGFESIEAHLSELDRHFRERLQRSHVVRSAFPIGERHVPIFAFVPNGRTADLNPLARILSDSYGIALSVGVQCCQPLYDNHGLEGALRASLYVYNTTAEIDRLFDALDELAPFLST